MTDPFCVAIIGEAHQNHQTRMQIETYILEEFQMYSDAVTLMGLNDSDAASEIFHHDPDRWKSLKVITTSLETKGKYIFHQPTLKHCQNDLGMFCHHFIFLDAVDPDTAKWVEELCHTKMVRHFDTQTLKWAPLESYDAWQLLQQSLTQLTTHP